MDVFYRQKQAGKSQLLDLNLVKEMNKNDGRNPSLDDVTLSHSCFPICTPLPADQRDLLVNSDRRVSLTRQAFGTQDGGPPAGFGPVIFLTTRFCSACRH